MELNTNENFENEREEQGKQKKLLPVIAGLCIGLVLILTLVGVRSCGKDNKNTDNGDGGLFATASEDNSMSGELDALMNYLKDMDDSVLYNSDALDQMGDYSSVVSNKIKNLKDSAQSIIDMINNYLNSGEDISPEVREMLTGLVEQLEKFKSSLEAKESDIKNLLEEYRTADSDRKAEIIKEINDIFKTLSSDVSKVRDFYNEILKYMDAMSDSEKKSNAGLWDMLNSLKNKMDRFLDKEFASLENLLSGDNITLSVKVDQGFADLSEVMDLLHEAIDKNQTDITTLLKEIETNDGKNIDIITKEFNTVKDNVKELKDEFKTAHEKVTKMLEDLDKNLEDHDKKLADHDKDMKDLLKTLQTDLEKVLDESFTAMEETLSDLGEKMENSFSEMTEVMNTNFGDTNENINNRFGIMKDDMTTNFNDMSTNMTNQYNSLTAVMNANDDDVKEFLQNIFDNLNNKLDTVFQYVSDGKRLLASALLTKGVDCAEDASFREIYEAILSIKQTLVIGVERIPGTIEYDYHYHTDGSGAIVGSASVGVSQQGGCYTTPIYHAHTGNSDHNGGCYTVAHTGTRTVGCRGYLQPDGMVFEPDTGGVTETRTCSVCGYHERGYGPSPCPNTTSESYTYYTLGCGMTTSTIIGYRPACGLSHGQMVGAHIVYEPAYNTGFNGDLNKQTRMMAAPTALLEPDYDRSVVEEGHTDLTEGSVDKAEITDDGSHEDKEEVTESDEEDGKNLDEENKDETETFADNTDNEAETENLGEMPLPENEE